jgi:hypothetical protein
MNFSNRVVQRTCILFAPYESDLPICQFALDTVRRKVASVPTSALVPPGDDGLSREQNLVRT